MEAENHNSQDTNSSQKVGQGYSDTSCKGGNQGGASCEESVCFLSFPGGEGQGEGGISTDYRPKTLKQICRGVVLQNGGTPSSLLIDTAERLYDETGFKGRLLHDSSSSGVPQIPMFCVQRDDIRIPMPSLRAEISPSSFHQTDDPNHSLHSEFGNKNSHLSGRHSNSGTGFPYQSKEVLSFPITTAHISGNYCQHCNHVSVLAAREAQHNPI